MVWRHMNGDGGITISVDQEVWTALKAAAEPFVDTPNSVLRRTLGIDDHRDGGSRRAGFPDEVDPTGVPAEARQSARNQNARPNGKASSRRRSSSRAPKGSLLPEESYELPILRVLQRHGGRAAAREAIAEVGELVRHQLTPLDQEELANGGERWQNRVQFTRLRLVKHGLMAKDSPRGIWEITDDGRAAIGDDGGAS